MVRTDGSINKKVQCHEIIDLGGWGKMEWRREKKREGLESSDEKAT